MSTVSVTNLKNAASGTNNIVLATDGSVSISGNNYSPQTGFKNRLINGSMTIDQRNAGALINPAVNGTYSVDRWFSISSQASKYSIGQNAGAVTPPAGFTNYLGLTSLSAYSVVSGDVFAVRQLIEGFNASDLGWGSASASSVALSFWVRSSLTGTFGGSLRNSAQTRAYPFTYTITTANTWEYKTISIAGDTSGTWLTNNGIGINVQFSIGSASDVSGTAGAWAAINYQSATGATSVVGTSGATFYITGVQLELGSVATPFEFRSIGTELGLCQRYYEDVSVAGSGSAATNMGITARYAVVKRAAPTIVRTGSWNSGGEAGSIVGINERAQFFVYNPTVAATLVGGVFTSSAEL
jgi:hypothetical protein